MIPFLKLVADDLYAKLGGDFQDTTIIFPNKRASLFFNEYLWENAEGKTMWAPEYTTISELFAQLSDCAVGDPIELTMKLWEVYRKRMEPTRSLDQLYGLMEMMLSDFQDIDNNLVDARKLFLNIANLKEMADFSFLEPEQRAAIEHFFGSFFDGNEGTTSLLKTRFKTMWNAMADIYEAYRETLLKTDEGEEPLVYEGLLKRRVVEALRSEDEEEQERISRRLGSKTYVMVGFNVLNQTELELFKYIKQEREAKFYWDYDVAYTRPMGTGLLSKYEAGQFIVENIRKLGNELEGRDVFQNMRKPKEIVLIQSPTDDAQARYIDEWTRTHVEKEETRKADGQQTDEEEETKDRMRESAVVLCDENLLQPVLHSIGEVEAVNVTMGYPLSNTPVHSMVQVLLDLQVHGRAGSGAWRYKYVAAVLKHAFIQKLAGKVCSEKLQMLTKNNVVFPNRTMFDDDETLKLLFTPVSGKELTDYLSDIIARVGCCYEEEHPSDSIGNPKNGQAEDTLNAQQEARENFTFQIYKESIFVAYTIVNRIRSLQEGYESLVVGDELLSRLILQLMSQATIPFHGEPAVGLQVMGGLETRNLDFRHVVMLSVNEGKLPKSDKRPSLIPYTLRAAYGMTTIEKEVSLYAYYYYRLIQRAESITLLYNSNTEGGGKGEMSRFMLQTLAEAETLFGEGQEIETKALTAACETMERESFSVVKDQKVMKQLWTRFNSEHILSPSAINTYIQCPLRFYFNYVAGLKPEDEVSEDVDRPMFGNIFHEAMHRLYEPYERKKFLSSEVRELAANEKLIIEKINLAFAIHLFHEREATSALNLKLNGKQLISRHVIKEFVVNQMTADAKMAEELEGEGGSWMIISQETRYNTTYIRAAKSSSGTKTSPHSTILLGGVIDRLDLLASPLGDRIRIVDYKTSSRAHVAKNVAELFDPEKCADNYHIMQTMYYCKVLTDGYAEYKNKAIVAALMYCAKDYGSNFSGIIKLTPSNGSKKEEMQDFQTQYGDEYNQLLAQKVEEIFTSHDEDPEKGVFAPCEDDKHCAYCDFLSFCNRHPQKQKY